MIHNEQEGVSRRRFLKTTGLAAAAMAAPYHLPAEEKVSAPGLVEKARAGAASAKVTVEELRGNVRVLMGAGGNIAVLPGHDGMLIVDAGFAGAQPQIRRALAGISADPVRHLVNSHWHFDHTDGNDWLHSAGAKILAHENTRKHLSSATRVEGWDFTFAPAPPGGIPSETLASQHTLDMNGTKIELRYYPPAHTDSDISIHFTDADILHVADTFWNGYYPFIDYSTGGSIDGTIRATQANLARITDKTIVIPGHGAVGNKAQLAFYYDLLTGTREKVAALKRQGKSLDEIVAAKPTAAYDEKWGGGFMGPRMFVGLVFEGV